MRRVEVGTKVRTVRWTASNMVTEGIELRRGVGFTYKNKSWSEYWASVAA